MCSGNAPGLYLVRVVDFPTEIKLGAFGIRIRSANDYTLLSVGRHISGI
jgi:hypothetical protein